MDVIHSGAIILYVTVPVSRLILVRIRYFSLLLGFRIREENKSLLVPWGGEICKNTQNMLLIALYG